MKVNDIATVNHVSAEDIITICKDLGINCGDTESDLSEKDVFLVQKKIESIKEQRARATRELLEKKTEQNDRKGAKIKLKRKVHVSKELIKEKAEEDARRHREGAAAPAAPAADAAKPAERPERKKTEAPRPTQRRPEQRRTSSGDRGAPRGRFDGPRPPRGTQDGRPSGQGRTFPEKRSEGVPVAAWGRPAEEKKPEIVAEKDKRKKAKEKEKEKDKKKYFKDKDKQSEKDIFARRKKGQQAREMEVERAAVPPKYIEITESISVGDLAKKLNVKASEVISKLMKLGMMATINQVIDAETAEILTSEYGTELKVVSLFEETVIRHEEEDRPEDRGKRPPIVTVMGHVDHGKTKLLDAIRETNVTEGEFGGITQHIGAYRVTVREQSVVFLDTPGHEAFTTMRARGASVTDIVVLVVAANDGVMPQTVEAINHARDAKVPIIVAINKIDLPDVNIAKIKQDLTQYELIPEEWGGTTLFAEVSAKKKLNIDNLLELILIQAEMLELKANPKLFAQGTVIESRIDPGRGPVATILVQNGTLSVGDPFVVGVYQGKVRAMFNDQGAPVSEVGPSTPVEVLGLSGVPSAGDPFQVVESEKYSKQISQKRLDLRRLEAAKKVRKVTLEDLNEMIKEGEVQELRVIIKADVDGSVQALKESLEKLSTGEVRIKVIHSGTGGINESDVMLASASNAIIIGYHVRPTARVSELAERESVSIKFYNIIFEVTADIKAAMEGMLSPEIKEEIVGAGEIRQVFKISKIGTVAGAIVLSGKLQRKNRVRIIRGGVVIFDGELKSLKRFKDDASEVDTGQECGFSFESYNDLKEGDNFEAYRTVQITKTLGG
jgi:translation initiation factor IF-2